MGKLPIAQGLARYGPDNFVRYDIVWDELSTLGLDRFNAKAFYTMPIFQPDLTMDNIVHALNVKLAEFMNASPEVLNPVLPEAGLRIPESDVARFSLSMCKSSFREAARVVIFLGVLRSVCASATWVSASVPTNCAPGVWRQISRCDVSCGVM